MVELGSASRIAEFVPVPRMVIGARPVCFETVSAGTKPARPSLVGPQTLERPRWKHNIQNQFESWLTLRHQFRAAA